MVEKQTLSEPVTAHRLHCIGCGAEIAGAEAAEDFRCRECGNLFEVEYPECCRADCFQAMRRFHPDPTQANRGFQSKISPARRGGWKEVWRGRRLSREALDRSGVWRFRELLPFMADERHVVTLEEGNTPLYHLPRCGKSLGMERLFAKHQGMNPTGSFKDTGMTAALSVAHEREYQWVACASTGNTSASMAAYAARAGMRSLVLIPEGKVAWGKLSQSLDYGAVTCQLKTDFDGCVSVLTELVRRAPVYLLNSVNPYRLEGQKTAAIELAESLDWQVPDHLIVPGGNLANSSALGKGFLELYALGLIDRLPRISVIQAEGANPLFLSWTQSRGKEFSPVEAHTRASAIRIGNPASWKKAVGILESHGRLVRAGQRAGDCAGEGGDWRGRHWLRAGLCSDAGGAEKAGGGGACRQTGKRSAAADRAYVEGPGIHHRLPPRESLLTAQETAAMGADQRKQMEALASAPQVLEPTVEAVMRVLDAAVRG